MHGVVGRFATLGIPMLSCLALGMGSGCTKSPAGAPTAANEQATPRMSGDAERRAITTPTAPPPGAPMSAPHEDTPSADLAAPAPSPVAPSRREAVGKALGPAAPATTMAASSEPAKRTRGALPSAPPSAIGDLGGSYFGVSSQFAGVKAGEWDDNANFREFQRFVATSPTSHRRVDLNDRRFLVVRDRNGRGIPRCRVTVRDGKQASTTYLTTASGRAILFPHAEGMTGETLSATASCAEGTAEASLPIVDGNGGVVDLRIPSERAALGTRIVDLAFVLDTTGSMSEEIAAVTATIQKVAKVLSTEQTTVRVGLVEYKDRQDPFVTKVYPFATDLAGFARRVSQISASGGGDTPEDMNAGLHTAIQDLSWSDRSVARLAFVIADAPPHLDYQDGPDYTADMKTASHRGIQLFTVAASGMDALGQVVFRQMAQFTGGTNMFVLRGGAGPQSTGGGDPASSCGGTHTNYSSGKLDELIVQKVRRELRAIDADPMRIAGLTMDENAKPCDQRVVAFD